MNKYIIINPNFQVKNPLYFYNKEEWKNYIDYSYSGPIENCAILDDIYTKFKYYKYDQVISFLSEYNIYPKDIYIIKYNLGKSYKLYWVITFNDCNYAWIKQYDDDYIETPLYYYNIVSCRFNYIHLIMDKFNNTPKKYSTLIELLHNLYD